METSRRPKAAGAAWLTAAVVLWFVPLVVTGQALALRDVLCDFLPWREHAAAALATGHLPLWSHASRLGQPFMAHPQSAVLYPPHLLWNVLPSVTALNAMLLAHLLLLALGARALGRRLGLSDAAATLAAGAVSFSTYTVAQMEFLPAFETVCWGPITALLALRLVDRLGESLRSALRPAVWLAAAWGVQALAGHPQALLQNVVLVGVVALGSASPRAWPRALTGLTGAGLLGAALAAPQLLVSIAHLGESTRSGAFDAGLGEASVAPRYLLGLVSPWWSGRPGYDGAWTDDAVFEFWAAACYVGLVPLLGLAALLVLRRPGARRGRVARTFGVLAALGLLLALGRHTPVYPLLAEHVPPFTFLRWPGKWLHLVAFALPFVGAVGIDALAARLSVRRGSWPSRTRAVAWGLVAIALLDAGLHARGVHPTIDAEAYDQAPSWAATAPPAGVARVHSTHSLGQVLLYARGEPEWFAWAHEASLGETGLTAGIERTWGFGQLIPRAQWRAWQALQSLDATQAERDRVADLLNVGLIIHGPPLDERAVRDRAPPPVRTLVRPGTLSRAFVVDRVVDAVDAESAWEIATSDGFDPHREVVISPPSAAPFPAGTAEAASADAPGGVGAVLHEPNRTVVDVVLDRPGLLVLLEPYDSRWLAWREQGRGAPQPLDVLQANGLMKAVRLPAGSHRVVFAYREPRLPIGVAVSILAVLLLGATWWTGRPLRTVPAPS